MGYIYVRKHDSYENACKLGKTINIPDRDTQYATGELKRGSFIQVYQIPIKKMDIIERLLQYEFKKYHVYYDAGIEFYDVEILNLIEPYFNTLNMEYKKLTMDEIDKLQRLSKIIKTLTKLKFNKVVKKKLCYVRDYQKKIIQYSKDEIEKNKKIYIELPTGGGKSFIVYNLFKELKSNFILIISPRKIINNQNVSNKYLKILKEHYNIFNYSNDTNIENFLNIKGKKIIVCCTQSLNRIYDDIKNIQNITIWFDEAHWCIEEYVNFLNNEKIFFWMKNTTNIIHRIFTSASPNKSIVLSNKDIFGMLYKEISVRNLIILKWLADIDVYVYSENKNADDTYFMLNDFIEKHKKFGFSFHNTQNNAYLLFLNHYKKFTKNETKIKPFLLVDNTFKVEEKINLTYDYKDIKVFESNIYSVGYVVAKYSMGYDFNKLDFLFFSDPKLSSQDISQCIGRGTRPDCLGENGQNKDKKLLVSLPVYVDNDNSYDTIIEVLKYLLYDVEIIFDDIEFKNRNYNKVETNEKNITNDETENIKSILLNLLEKNIILNFDKTKKFLKDNNIKTKKDYYALCNIDKRFSKEPEIDFNKKFTNWIDFLNIERKYYDLETCKIKVCEHLKQNEELRKNYLNLFFITTKLCEMDCLYPPCDLWLDYYNVMDLNKIIVIKQKKFKK